MPTPTFDAAEALGLDSSSDPQDFDQDAQADSSTAEDGKVPSLEDVIRDAVSPDSSPEEGSGSEDGADVDDEQPVGEEPDGEQESGGDQEPATPLSEEEVLARLEAEMREQGRSLQKVQRFREVLAENKELKGEVGDLRAIRQNLDTIASAAQQSGMSEQLLSDIFSVPVLMANDPSAGLSKLREISDQLSALAGEKLTPELQTKVEEGYLSEEDAREITRARAEAERERRFRQIDEQRRAEQARAKEIENANASLAKFVKSLAETDPDYTPAAQRLHVDRVAAIVRQAGKPPSSIDEGIAISRRAWEEVKQTLKQLAPKQQSIRAVTGLRTNSAPKTAPSSMLEAISEAVGGAAHED